MAIRKLLTAAMLTTGVAAFAAGSAYATPFISGSIDVAGIQSSHTSNTIHFNTKPGKTSIDIVSGSFAELGTCTGCVSIAASLSSPPSSNPFQLFTATSNGDTVVLKVTSDLFTPGKMGALQITGTGIASLTGFADTNVSFSLTVPRNGPASFDISTAVPEPGTLALFGAGLLGCALFIGRRRHSTRA